MDQLDNTGKVDPVDLIREIRKGRYNLVQRTAQYKLAWQACVNYARGLLQVRPRGGTIMSISTESEMSSKMSAKLRRQSMAKTGDWDVQYIDGTCTDDSPTLFFFVNSRTLVGSRGFRNGCPKVPLSAVLSVQ